MNRVPMRRYRGRRGRRERAVGIRSPIEMVGSNRGHDSEYRDGPHEIFFGFKKRKWLSSRLSSTLSPD
jgi:hypothetical protein